MESFADGRKHLSSERLITLSVVTIITLASIVLMLSCSSPELCWDEADYAKSTAMPWSFLWSKAAYGRHGHGPMAIYLAKLGQELLPAGTVSIEVRLRFLVALVASLAVGLLYWTLRRSFGTSRAAALAGSGLLLFSVIRLEETNIIGPHHLMLACTLAIIALGYQWRERPTVQAALGLGAVMAFGALSMTYVIPAALCWAVAVSLAGKEWFAWDRTHFRVSWSVLVIFATAAIIVAALWPPGVVHRVVVHDFGIYLHYPPFPTLVKDRIEFPPRSAAIYWLAHLDAPIFVFSITIISVALWKAFRSGRLSSKHSYLAVSLAFFAATMLAAHMAGARNMLQFIGVLCLATGALFDEALGYHYQPRLIWFGSAAVIILAALNVIWHSRSSSYTPYLATDGYRAFLKGNEKRLAAKSKALASDLPVLKFYAEQYGTSLAWDVSQMPSTIRADAPLPEVQYVLISALAYNYMPADHPIRRVVAEHWKVAWSFKGDHTWEIRLYEKPQANAP
jgi:Dolichyl-phosphate-mannose-protein mannosyltransferase